MKKKKDKKMKSIKKIDENKTNLFSKFIKAIKKKWLIDGTTTFLLIAILIALFILINIGIKKLDLTPLDLTTSKQYTLTEESKERVKNIDKEFTIYFVGAEEDDPSYTLSKQYNKANSKIKIEIVDAKKNLEFAKKYELDEEGTSIIVTCGEQFKKLTSADLYTYDSNYNTIDLTEQKITSAILNLNANDIPKVYFLKGFSKATFDNGLYYLSQYLNDEVLTYDSLDILNAGKVPNDCDTLVIMTPEKDFDNITTKAIQKYIKKGGNILWLNSAYIDKSIKLDNVNKILSQYGVKPFDVGYIYETNRNNIILEYPTCFIPEIQSSNITDDIAKDKGVVFIRGTKINLDTDKFEKLKVTNTELLTSSNTSYFTTDLTGETNAKKDQKGSFTVGAKLTKTIKESKDEEKDDSITSTLVIYGDGDFITDTVLTYSAQGQTITAAQIFNNPDLVLNSIADLTNNDKDITIRRDYTDSQTSFTPTDGEKTVIVRIIFIIPIAIIALGIIVWIIRKNKK